MFSFHQLFFCVVGLSHLEIFNILSGLLWWLRPEASTCSVGDLSLIPGLGRSPGGEHGNPLQYSCLENPQGQRSLAGYKSMGSERVGHNWTSKHSIAQYSIVYMVYTDHIFFIHSSITGHLSCFYDLVIWKGKCAPMSIEIIFNPCYMVWKQYLSIKKNILRTFLVV